MKKLTITIALLLVVALAMPVLADSHGSFSDVESDHWAYDAINKLVAAGIVEGYPDGEFKGSQNMTRYEMAVMVSRALDNIVDEQEALANEVDEMGEGLTTGQAEDVTAIVKSLMEKNSQDELSDAQAEEVADIVDALTFELQAELKVLGADMDALGKDVDELEAKVDEMDVPEDNIEFGADIATILEAASYTENEGLTRWMIEDGDAYDDDAFSNKAFYQEIDFDVTGEVSGAEFNLELGTIANYFAEDHDYGAPTTDDNDLTLDNALLEVSYNDLGMKMGDLGDYHVAQYFIDEEDMEGVEATYNYMDFDITGFVLGEDANEDLAVSIDQGTTAGIDHFVYGYDDASGLNTNEDYIDVISAENTRDTYGMNVSRDLDMATVTAKVNQVRAHGDSISNVGLEVSDFEPADNITLGGEVAFNRSDLEGTTEDDLFASINGEMEVYDGLTVNALFEMVGPDFANYAGDFAGSGLGTGTEYYVGTGVNGVATASAPFVPVDYNKFEVGAEYELNEDNTVDGTFTFVQPGDDNYTSAAEDKMTAEGSLENVYGDFTNTVSAEYTMNDEFIEDVNVRVLSLGTEYAWNESTTLGAKFTNKLWEVVDDEVSYNYLEGNMTKELNDNMTWETTAQYLIGEEDVAGTTADAEGSAMKTSLSVSF